MSEVNEIKTKVCPGCGRELPAEMFGHHAKTKDGLQPKCKECRAAARKKKPEPEEPVELDAQSSLSLLDDQVLVNELRCRGWEVKCTKLLEL